MRCGSTGDVLPTELLAPATLGTAAWGALLGFALGLAGYVFSDWPIIWHRLEKRLMIARGHANAHDWPDEPEGYVPNALTGRERAALPQTLLMMTIGGALWMVADRNDNQFLMFLVIAGASILVVLRLLASDDAEEVGADPSVASDDENGSGRFRRIGIELATIAFFAAIMLDPVQQAIIDWVVHGPRGMVWGAVVFGASLAGYGLWRWWHSPERERTELYLPKEAVIGFVGALVIVGVIIALAVFV